MRPDTDQVRRINSNAEAILESITDAFFAVSSEWRFTYVNRHAEQILGREPDDLLGKIIWEEYPGLTGSEFEQAYRLAATDRVPTSFTSFYPDHDRWYEVHVYPAADGISVYFRDVSERMKAQELLRDSEKRFRLMADAIPQMVWLADSDGRAEFFNRQWSTYTGGPFEPANASEVIENFVHPDDRVRTTSAWDAARREGHTFLVEHRIRSASGEYRWFLVRAEPYRDPKTGNILRWFGTSTDVHDRKIAEAAMMKSEQRYRTLFESIDEGFCIIEMIFDKTGKPSDYRFLEINPTFEQQTGLRAAVGKTVRKLVPQHEKNWFEIYGKVAATGESIRFESEAKAMNRWFDVYAFRVDHPDERRVAILFKDISSRKRSEDELRQADRRKDEFLAMLAHELRNPLAPIATAAEILKMGRLDDKRVRDTSAIIARQVDHMTSLVNDLLDVSRVTRGLVTLEQRPVDLKVVVDDAVEQVRPMLEARRQRLTVQLAAEPAYVQGDKVRLVQIIANLLNNAAKYTPQQGTIQMAIEVAQNEVELGVSDNGIGIAPELLPDIFGLFAQGERSADRSQGGLGLGLALVKSIVELHGGTVAAKSAGVGKGSQFTIRLPRLTATDDRRDLRHPAAMRHSPAGQLHVMIVDDNRDAAQTLAELLESYGYTVSVAHDAPTALEQAAANAPQAFILDIGLPDMDGYALARELQTFPDTERAVFIALTGYGRDHDREQSTAARFDHHLMKPVDTPRLCALLAESTANQSRNR
jgi:PAS domain S-box-containing protein